MRYIQLHEKYGNVIVTYYEGSISSTCQGQTTIIHNDATAYAEVAKISQIWIRDAAMKAK